MAKKRPATEEKATDERVSARTKYIVFAAIAVLLLVRLFGLHQMIADDEGANLNAITAHPYASEFQIIPHPPTVAFLYSIGGYLWGATGARIVCWIVGILSILFTYRLAKRMHGERAALFAAGILAVSFWAMFDAVQINVENVFSLVLLFATIAYLNYSWVKESQRVRASVIAGVLLGAAFLTKYSAVLLAAAIGIEGMIVFFKRERKRSLVVRDHLLIVGIALAMLIAYFAITILTNSPFGARTVQHGADYLTGFLTQNWLNVLSILIQAIFFISPLLLGLLVLGLANYDKKQRLLWITIAVFIVFYLFIMSVSFRAFERFWAPLLPAIAIIGGSFLAKLRMRHHDAVLLAASTVAGYLVLLFFQLYPGDVFPIYPKSAYVARVLSMHWNFFVPFHGSTGPFGFFVQFSTLMAGFIIASLMLLGYFIARGRAARVLLLVFLGVSLAYNAVLVQEYLFSATTPDVNGVAWQVNDYVHANIPTSRPIAAYQLFGQYTLREYNLTYFGYNPPDDAATTAMLASTNRVLVIVDYPVITKDSDFWRKINTCELLQSFSDKGVTLGYVFDCARRTTFP